MVAKSRSAYICHMAYGSSPVMEHSDRVVDRRAAPAGRLIELVAFGVVGELRTATVMFTDLVASTARALPGERATAVDVVYWGRNGPNESITLRALRALCVGGVYRATGWGPA